MRVPVEQVASAVLEGLDWLSRLFHLMKSWYMDVEYETIPIGLLHQALKDWREQVLKYLHYTPEVFDCDDFAFYFKTWLQGWAFDHGLPFNGVGLAIGTVESSGGLLGWHAWNIVLADDNNELKIVYVEPQIGEVISGRKTSDGWIYKLKAVIV